MIAKVERHPARFSVRPTGAAHQRRCEARNGHAFNLHSLLDNYKVYKQ